MTYHSRPPLGPELRARCEPITVLTVAADRGYLDRIETILGDEARLDVRTAPAMADALERLDDVDGLVIESATLDESTTPDGDSTETDAIDGNPTETDATDGNPSETDVFDRIRRRVPDLPVVLLTDGDGRARTVADAVRSRQWTEWTDGTGETTAVLERLSRRIHALVDRRRLAALSKRSLASIELARDPIAIVDSTGAIEFANRAYAVRFGYGHGELSGHPWQRLFTDETVERLESTAVPTVADGWRWTGTCTGRRKAGDTFPARIRLGGLEDGSLVFVVADSDGGSETAE